MRRLPIVGLLCLGLAASSACREKRKPLARGDGGPAVVMFDGRNVDLAIQLPATPEVEPNDGAAQAQGLTDGARIAGRVGAGAKGDQDWFSLAPTVRANDLGANDDAGSAPPEVAFVTLAAGPEAVVLELVDARGRVLLARTAQAGQRASLSHLAMSTSAPTLLRVRPPAKAGPSERAYTIECARRTSEAAEELEPNDDAARAFAFPAAGLVTGKLDGADDKDLFHLPAIPGGSTYRIELAGVPDLAPEIRIRSGTSVLSVARTGRGGELRLRNAPADAAEPLLLQLRAVDGMSELDYQLRVVSEPPIDASVEREPNDDRAHANVVNPAATWMGYLWPADADWFCSEQPLGATVDAMPDIDWKLESFSSDGKSVAKADSGKRGAVESLAAHPLARCVRLTARARDCAFDSPYRITFVTAE